MIVAVVVVIVNWNIDTYPFL